MPKIRSTYFVTSFALMIALHIFANRFGLYEQKIIWIDKILHLIAGVALAMLWLWVLQRFPKVALVNTPKITTISSIFGFVLFAAVVWEVVEYAFWQIAPHHAVALNLYSPTILDALGDIIANFAGAVLFALLVFRKGKRDTNVGTQ